MEDVLLTALTAERVLLRKEIRHCQSEHKALTARAEQLETEVMTLEEVIDDHRTAKFDVQAASAASLEAKLSAQKEWNSKAEAKVTKLSAALRRKRESRNWMAESKDYLGQELLGLLTSLQHFTAMQRSEQLSDVQYIGDQVKVKLLHSQFAAEHDIQTRRRHAATLSVLLSDTADKEQYLRGSTDKKLSALLWEREKFTRQLQLAKQLAHSKRTPIVEATGDIKDAHLAQCMYLPRAAASRSASAGGVDSISELRGVVSASSITRFHDPQAPRLTDDVPSSATKREVSVGAADATSLSFHDDESVTELLPLSEARPQRAGSASQNTHTTTMVTTKQSHVIADEQHESLKDEPAAPSCVSTPRFSRGPTPRFGTPKMTPNVAALDEVPIVSGRQPPKPAAKDQAPSVGVGSQIKTIKKPKPQRLLSPAVAVRPSGRATPPSNFSQKVKPSIPLVPTLHIPPAEAAAPQVAAVSPVVDDRAAPSMKSAASLNKALQTAPPMLARFAYSRTGASKIAFGVNT
jgi:hypothetical protein